MTMLDIDAADRDMIERGDRIGADLARQLLRFYDERAAAVPADIAALVERLEAFCDASHNPHPDTNTFTVGVWRAIVADAGRLADEAASALSALSASLAAVKEMYAREGAKALYELERAEAAEAYLTEARKALTDALAFIDKTSGTALGIAMSGNNHPNPDGALMDLSQEGMALSESIRAARRALTGGKEDA